MQKRYMKSLFWTLRNGWRFNILNKKFSRIVAIILAILMFGSVFGAVIQAFAFSPEVMAIVNTGDNNSRNMIIVIAVVAVVLILTMVVVPMITKKKK